MDSSRPERSPFSEAGHRRCVACGALAPSTDTSYTLISSQHGWRLSRTLNADGTRTVEWRCPPCWDRHKQLRR